MGARSAISVEEYLHTSFEDTDREYRNGELVERSVPDYPHGKTQGLLVAFFAAFRKTMPVFACVETRMKIRTGLYLIPDVAVFWPSRPLGGIPEAPPLIAIEILSPGDRIKTVRSKLAEYRQWGVRHTWLVDPHSRRMWVFVDDLAEVSVFEVPELGSRLTGSDVFE